MPEGRSLWYLPEQPKSHKLSKITFRVKCAQRQCESLQALSWHGCRQNIWQQNNTSSTETCMSQHLPCCWAHPSEEELLPRARSPGCDCQPPWAFEPLFPGAVAVMPLREPELMENCHLQQQQSPGQEGSKEGALSHLLSAVLWIRSAAVSEGAAA